MRRSKRQLKQDCRIELLEARSLFSTTVNLDLSSVQQVLHGTQQFQPALSYNGNFGVLVTATPGASASAAGSLITASLLDANGAPTGTSVQVNPSVLNVDDHPDVATAADGSFIVTWTSQTSIYFQKFSASAQPIGIATKVSGSLVADNSAVAYTTNGNFVVTYQAVNGANLLDVFAQLYNAAGTANGSPIRVNTTLAGLQQNPRVSSDPEGNFTVVWQGATGGVAFDDIFSQRFDVTGAPLGVQTLVNTTTAGEQADPDVATWSNGSYIVAWDSTSAGLTGIVFQQYDDTGAAMGVEMPASAAGLSVQSNPSVAIRNDGIFGIAWVNTTIVATSTEARYYLPSGAAITNPVTLSSQGEIATRTAIQFIPSGVTVEAYGTSVSSMLNTDIQTIIPELEIDGSSPTNVLDATFTDLLVTVENDGTESVFPTAILQGIDIEGGTGRDTITVTGASTTWNGDLMIDGNAGDDTITLGDLARATINGGDGNDTITVGSGSDSVTGGAGNDSIVGGAGSDALFGGDGNDTIVSGSGASILDGGNGDDTLIANNVGEELNGDDGNDILLGGTGNDTLNGGNGNDTINGGGGNDSVNGGDGNDLLYAGQGGNSTIRGGNGTDTVSYAFELQPVFVKLGGFSHNGIAGENDFIAADVENAIGGAGNDTLVGTAGDNALYGGAGNDLLESGDGNDLLDGNSGNDTLEGGIGNDNFIGASGIDTVTFANRTANLILNIDGLPDSGSRGQLDTIQLSVENIIGGSGNDVITGSNFNNLIEGGAGDDTIYGMGGSDTLLAGAGKDRIDGGSGNDLIKGGKGADLLKGGTGDDTIFAGSGADILHGNTGNDSLIAGSGTDSLFGDAGNDTLISGTGMDLLNGGTGFDKAMAKQGDALKAIEELLH